MTPSSLQVLLLGPIEAASDGRPLVLDRRQERCLVALLALEPGRVVPFERLGDLLWDGRPPDRYRALLHTRVAGVRAGLHRIGADGALRTASGGYLLDIPCDRIDAHRFRECLARARTVAEPNRRAALLRAGLDLWRGPALADLGPEPLRQRLAGELDELRATAQEWWISALLDAGRPAEASGELARLAAEYPLREFLVELRLRAVAACGRAAEALEIFETYRRRLADETGLDPGRGLSDVRLAILRGEAVGTAHAGAGPAGAVPGTEAVDGAAIGGGVEVTECPRPRQLPYDVADFTGRGAEASQILAALAGPGDSPTVVISAMSGQAGIGKTALAVHVAHRLAGRYPDGQLYINLRGAEERPLEPAEVLAQFLRALGVASTAVPESVAERAAMYRSLLAERRVLVVLDNAADERQVRELLPGSGNAVVLVTSRRRLAGLPGARPISLEVLTDEQAMALLARIVGDDLVGAEPTAASELVRLCAGLPLALRVVGARLAARPHWSLASLVDRLSGEHRRLDELAHADLAVRASLTLSYRGLAEIERRLLRRLAALDTPDFAGWVAAAVLDTDHETGLTALDGLVAVHLLTVTGVDRVGQPRYRFHDLVRLYGRDRCAAEETPGERRAALARAFGGWLVLTQRARTYYYGDDFPTRLREAPRWTADDATMALTRERPMDWLIAERPCLNAGIRQASLEGLGPTCWELEAATSIVFTVNNYVDDWAEAAGHALHAARSVGSARGEAVALLEECFAFDERFLPTEAYASASTAAERFGMIGDPHGEATAMFIMATIERRRGEWTTSLARFEQIAPVFHAVDDHFWYTTALVNIARIHLRFGRAAEAGAALRDASAVAESSGTLRAKAFARLATGELYLELNEYREAARILRTALDVVRALDNKTGESYTLLQLGQAATRADDHVRGHEYLNEALRLARSHRARAVEPAIKEALARLHLAQGDVPMAIRWFMAALDLNISLGIRGQAIAILDDLAEAYERTGDAARAEAARERGARLRAEAGGEAAPGQA